MSKENTQNGNHKEALSPLAISLSRELERQAERYAEAGFNIVLGMTRKEYLLSLPTVVDINLPEFLLSRPVLVDKRIAPSVQADLAGVKYYLDDSSVQDWHDPQGFTTPDIPYVAWLKNPEENTGKSAHEIREKLALDERGATLYEGIALLITSPELMNEKSITLPGSTVMENSVPVLHRWEDNIVGIGYERASLNEPSFGPAVCVKTQ